MQFWGRVALLPQPAPATGDAAQQPSTSRAGSSAEQRGEWTAASAPGLLAAAAAVVFIAGTSGGAAHAADLHAGAAQHLQPLADLAEGEEFWGNVGRYARYFVTVMLGTGYVMARPVIELFKKPVTAVLAVIGVAGTAALLKFTLDAMLGISEPVSYEYF
jgi:hypothetical protein